jgi:hypothetical protein
MSRQFPLSALQSREAGLVAADGSNEKAAECGV